MLAIPPTLVQGARTVNQTYKKSPFLPAFLAIVVASLIILACSKEVLSGPRFVFKSASNGAIAAKFSDREISVEELNRGIENDIFELEHKIHQLKMGRLRALVLKQLLESDPRSKNLSNDEYLDKYIAKGLKVSAKEVEDFIKERKIPQNHINDHMRERIEQHLMREKKQRAVDRWLGEKTARNPVEVYLNRPVRPTFQVDTAGAPLKGDAKAPVTIVEFSDFQCPFCARGVGIIAELSKKYGKKLRVAFKNFPLPSHTNAHLASEAGMCVFQQDAAKFWRMHDRMFETQDQLGREGLIAKARELGIDVEKFTACLDNGEQKARVQADVAQGQQLGIRSTPTFFINGKMLTGAQSIETFSEIIDQELAK